MEGWRDEVKDLRFRRGLRGIEGLVLTRDRKAWASKVYRSD